MKHKFTSALLILAASYPFFEASRAHATDFHLGIESDFSRNTVTPAVFPFIRAGIESHSDENSDSEHKLDAEVKISPTHPNAKTLSSRNFYWGQKPNATQENGALQFSFGRKLIGWSNIDEIWQLGAFEPLDSWDRLRSFSQGLTGVFAAVQTPYLNFQFFGSYLFIPEITPNVIIENNHFVSDHPQSVANAPQSINVIGRPLPVGYKLEVPSLTSIIFRPSFAVMVDTKRENAVYGKFSYGFMPLNYFPVAVEGVWDFPSNTVPVTLHPRLINHHLINGEIEYKFTETQTVGFTALGDIPLNDDIPSNYTATPLSTSVSLTPWWRYKVERTSLLASHLWTEGGLENDVGKAANANGASLFSSRILYRSASQLALRQALSASAHPSVLQVKGVHEFTINANWIAIDFFYSPIPTLTFLFGCDTISAEKNAAPDHGAEFLADMKAIDRFRLGVTYVF